MRSIKFDTLQPRPESIRPRPSQQIVAPPMPPQPPGTPAAPPPAK